MKKVNRIWKVVIAVLLMAVLIAPTAMAKGKSEKEFETGRTAQQVTTGVILPDQESSFSIEKGTESVTFSGIVTIDGPRLFMKIGNNVVTDLVKVDDKVWAYSYTLNTSDLAPNKYSFEVYAHSYYPKGTPESDIHTLATSVVHELTVYEPVVEEKLPVLEKFYLVLQNKNQYKIYGVYNVGDAIDHGNINHKQGQAANPGIITFEGLDGKEYTITFENVDGFDVIKVNGVLYPEWTE